MDPVQKAISKHAVSKLQKFTPKQISENKLKAFSIGNMGRAIPPKEMEERKKKREEEEAIKNVHQDFLEHFDDKPATKINKTWVKAGTFDAGSRKEDSSGKGTLYKPTSKLVEQAESVSSTAKAVEEARKKAEALARPGKPGKKNKMEKKKTNLEIFKEELKAIQEERDKRNEYKAMIKAGGTPIPGKSMLDIPVGGGALGDMLADVGGNTSTTNLYLGNLSPRLTEPVLTEMFGRFGPLASVKIMYPRTEDEKLRGKHCGFVAYMARCDGERALAALGGKNIEGFEMRMGWGKPVPLPLHPVYVPPALVKFTQPPPPSGLPFNCQPHVKDKERWGGGWMGRPQPVPQEEKEKKKFDRMLSRATVKVVIPTDRTQLCIINRMVEFVMREGPIFEAAIMNRELSNPQFKFLFENQSPEHTYYRWRLYSMLQGDTKDKWSSEPFRMFRRGSLWRPPLANIYTDGMPAELLDSEGASIDPAEEERRGGGGGGAAGGDRKEAQKAPPPPPPAAPGKRPLSDDQRDILEETLRSLLPDRNAIAEAMVWCIEHADSGEEIVECLAESLAILETPTVKKIARLFLISDILHNCTVKSVKNVSFYRTGFQAKLTEIFSHLNATYKNIPSRMKAESFKQRIVACFKAWEDWALYPGQFLIQLQNIFLGLVSSSSPAPEDEDKAASAEDTDEDVDGVPLDGAALLKARGGGGGGGARGGADSVGDDASDDDGDSLDGAPLVASERKKAPAPPKPSGFVTSKWETVDPEDVKRGVVTTSKWEVEETEPLVKARKALMGSVASKWDDKEDDIDGEPLRSHGHGSDSDSGELPDLDTRVTEQRRALLRDVEVKVMQYQDELESGRKSIKSGWTISEQVEHYRRKVMKKATEDRDSSSPPPSSRRGRSVSDSPERRPEKVGKKKKRRRTRSESRSRSKSRNRSPEKKKERRRGRSSSSSPERVSKRGGGGRDRSRSGPPKRSKRSRSRSPKKHKKKSRH